MNPSDRHICVLLIETSSLFSISFSPAEKVQRDFDIHGHTGLMKSGGNVNIEFIIPPIFPTDFLRLPVAHRSSIHRHHCVAP
jgi:hypothetical protein